jgi:hypothetical protein
VKISSREGQNEGHRKRGRMISDEAEEGGNQSITVRTKGSTPFMVPRGKEVN